jgi:hypothetical protein
MRGHILRVLKRAAVLQKVRDPCRPEGVIADRGSDAGRSCAPAD